MKAQYTLIVYGNFPEGSALRSSFIADEQASYKLTVLRCQSLSDLKQLLSSQTEYTVTILDADTDIIGQLKELSASSSIPCTFITVANEARINGLLGAEESKLQKFVVRTKSSSMTTSRLCHAVAQSFYEHHQKMLKSRPEETFQTKLNVIWSFMKHAPMSACILDNTGQLYYTNAAFEDFLGYSDGELNKRNYSDVIDESHQSSYQDLLNEVVEGKRQSFQTSLRYKHKNGQVLWGDPIYVALLDEVGQKKYLLVLVIDITEKKAYEKHLQQSSQLQALGQFASGIAHDFNNILSIISSYSAIANQSVQTDLSLSEEEKALICDPLMRIQRAADHGAQLTRRIQLFTHSSSGKTKPIDLNEVIYESESFFKTILPQNISLNITTNFLPGRIRTNENSLQQIIMNLVLNARDAMSEGGEIQIQTDHITVPPSLSIPQSLPDDIPSGNYARLSVSDTGNGIAPEIRSKIFDPFFTTKDSSKGTGLGLFIVSDLVKEERGYIYVQSKPEEGTQISIYFPYTDIMPQSSARKGLRV